MKIVKIFSILIAVLFTAVSCVFPNGGDNEGETSKIDCFVVGAWRIKSFCGMPADADIYIEFRKSATFRCMESARRSSISHTRVRLERLLPML